MKKLLALSLLSGVVFATTSCNDDDDVMVPTEPTMVHAFVSSNTSSMITTMDITDMSMISVMQKSINSADADGIYYDGDRDEILQASRTNNRIDAYNNVMGQGQSLNLQASSTSDFTNARGLTVSGNRVVVAQDAMDNDPNGMNRLLVYERTAQGFNLLNTYDVDFNLWGIRAIGENLYAIVDNSSDMVVFNNFFANNNGMIMPTKRVTVEGIVRTHGLWYSTQDNIMVLTDVADAASDTDGAVHVINNFTSVFNSTANGATIPLSSQVRIAGSSTLLGNPVDVAYDDASKRIFVAERANGGGQVLVYNLPTANGNPAPVYKADVAGASSIYIHAE
ncbi:hypothetical protein FVR03_19350 [Pontibacter qinzhouensis]|uniref:Uncharacterized protein n=1 Tax=Pontibacter qinzhouensis TaxID=2603253 RepID=A0A5C8J5Q1_9BACT|nr:hypothetical protein [Pontibacter qinzhouensis]TXK33245.1 hypothetical protein FVR03_19350 [Pontibacter qinzhouensis]